MRAAAVAVGSELLGLDRLDTNSLRLTRSLDRFGVELVRKVVVGDNVEAIADELSRLAAEVDLVVVSGGLGPTADDVTREAACRAFGLEMRVEPAIVAQIEERFRRHGLTMPRVNRRQAEVPAGAEWVANERGTAPAIVLERDGCTLFLLPGVPGEFDGLVASVVEPWLASRWTGGGVERAVVKVACLPESRVEERIAPAYEEFGREAVTILAKPGEVHVYATAVGAPEERRRRLSAMQDRLEELAGDAVFARDEATTLEAAVGALLIARAETVATAESCTGGLLAERLTRVPGSSAYVLGGVVAYSNAAKVRDLGVEAAVIERHGAVSQPVAEALAAGARRRFGSDWGVGVTGVAGPGGGSEEKPVGTVHIAVGMPDGTCLHRVRVFPGDRERVRTQSAQWAFDMLRRAASGLPGLD